ncbi:MAG: hypothetical protein ACUVT9_02760 [Candidatus Bathycorpusculaceae bacterium]
MMHTINLITHLKTQENVLKMKIKEKEKKKPKNELTTVEFLSLKLYNNVLESICAALWAFHLLKTSLVITKTPLTTFKSIVKGGLLRR